MTAVVAALHLAPRKRISGERCIHQDEDVRDDPQQCMSAVRMATTVRWQTVNMVSFPRLGHWLRRGSVVRLATLGRMERLWSRLFLAVIDDATRM